MFQSRLRAAFFWAWPHARDEPALRAAAIVAIEAWPHARDEPALRGQ